MEWVELMKELGEEKEEKTAIPSARNQLCLE